jgi:hypothetical protein
LTNLPPLSIDQKWSMVESDERLRWKDEKTREEQAKKIPEQSRSGMIEERSSEWYLMKFMDRSITIQDASGLLASLRGAFYTIPRLPLAYQVKFSLSMIDDSSSLSRTFVARGSKGLSCLPVVCF